MGDTDSQMLKRLKLRVTDDSFISLNPVQLLEYVHVHTNPPDAPVQGCA